MRKDDHQNPSHILQLISDISPRLNAEHLRVYLEELLSWNRSLGLMSKRDPERTAAKLIRLSVDLWDFLAGDISLEGFSDSARVLDIGPGGGFPGIIWKLLNPRLSMVLIERKERKALFLDRIIKQLGLSGAEVINADVRDLIRLPDHQGSFQLIGMLAVAHPTDLAEAIEALLASPGYFCSVRGADEKIIPDIIGETLRLRRAVSFDEGIFVLYEKSDE
ncbi:MAG: hypothetical protein GTO51_03010 [Candidatus Latescibacteria bacterium]|nr:hypothetical protein [Candidatus Latescibacterota bacterium]NIM22654.1 hypothetical protein [Candidatus Latescibacterota bacterium]NIM64943.1 hypothetical protein [Candidatus Latescibacterota bacterium]NIO01458.1 hypothetical protein [Candidatus Latescibacterota bacterium]NIO27968.1 hypothetical protein [Candidatus Latescibacterota bacterium]